MSTTSAVITTVCNQKGGVGKTATTTGVSSALAKQGLRVLVVDMDPQANASNTLAPELNEHSFTTLDVLKYADSPNAAQAIRQAIVPAAPAWAGINLIPSERALSDREVDNSAGRERRLAVALALVADEYDHIVIDCPPSLGLLTTNALTAATQALIVTEPRRDPMLAVNEMITTIYTIKAAYNPTLALAGVVLNRWRVNQTDRTEWFEKATTDLGKALLPTLIPEREAIPRAASRHVPTSDPAVADTYAAIAAHLIAAATNGDN